ncbi:N-acetylmuramoyl-L-alanine amidase family protein [Croceivirga thetidis]|uniref:N-acetylmuramoyl-L-alanine amidase n=1 Tax=Croceivirga thetidis TaxID=2721623 RepID=A0ABX1GP17_9FLAO|nr:N-acetylmuramoyl-L-alanine amidase [Croceivirga thetidis]NKI31663.1 N-acetylmuramoyl-L-alanine amidase [Croceivirga thetidis]
MTIIRISVLFFCLGFFIQTVALAQDSTRTVTAEAGDGIFSILRRNGLNPAEYLNPFIELNRESLGDDFGLTVGAKYQLPKLKTMGKKVRAVSYPIFGKENEVVDSLSNQLRGAVYYLIAGHGGPDPGAITKYRDMLVAEDEYAYDITLRLAKELISHGAEVHLIIKDENDGIRDDRILDMDTDETAMGETIPLNQLARLKQRTDQVNELYLQKRGKYQRLLVTHVDSRAKGTNIDVFFYHHEKSKNGKRLAESIHETFKKKYKRFQPNRKYTGTFSERSNLYLVKNTYPAMVYIEVGNIKNQKDQKRIFDPENRQALAKWISEGLLLDFKTRNSSN